MGKFGPKNQNYQLKLKFGTCTNSDIQNSMVIFTFSVFDRESTFFGKFGPKNQNYQSKLKFGTYSNSNMQNSMAMFTFFVFGRKYPVWANLIQIVNIYSFFLFPIRNALFLENLVQNVKVVSLRLNSLATIFCKICLGFSRFHWKSWFEVKVKRCFLAIFDKITVGCNCQWGDGY